MPINEHVLSEARALVRKAGMDAFVPVGSAPVSEGAERVIEIALIDPPTRNASVPNFDKPDPDRPGVLRSASILSAIRDGVPLPPVILFQRTGGGAIRASRGFPSLPPICGTGFHSRSRGGD